MTTQPLTTLLERLEKAGARLKFYVLSEFWRFDFEPGFSGFYKVGETPNFYKQALLLGWAVQQIEAQGYRRQIDWYSDGDKSLWEVGVFKAPDDRTLVYGPAVFATELEASLQALAEMLEARRV